MNVSLSNRHRRVSHQVHYRTDVRARLTETRTERMAQGVEDEVFRESEELSDSRVLLV